jgi:hypothetical protein
VRAIIDLCSTLHWMQGFWGRQTGSYPEKGFWELSLERPLPGGF